jgi:integrase
MPNEKERRRRFGAVRQLPSGQWQARYRGPDDIMRSADHTFQTKTDAEVWLTRKEAEILEGDWINPDAGKVLLVDFGNSWIDERPGLRPKTITLYRYLLRAHIAPHFEGKTVAEIKEGGIRRWRKKLLDNEVSAVTTAKAYRLLKAILNTAVDDGIIKRNPCRIKGAGLEKSPERPVLTIPQVFALADSIEPRYSALVLLGTFASLRWGELAGLRRKDIDLANGNIRVERQLTEMPGGGYAFGAPKSDAGIRTVPVPDLILPRIRWHLASFTDAKDDALVFTSPTGSPMRNSNFRRRAWLPALTAAGLPSIHFHDLRHTGNTLTADAGANLRELMERMGHSSTKAALVYLHSTSERQHAIADAVSKQAKAALRRAKADKADAQGADATSSANSVKPSGMKVARRRGRAS